MLKAPRKSAAISSRREICPVLSRGHRGALFQLRLNYAWCEQVTTESKKGKITKQRRAPRMPATDKKKRTATGVERVERYTRAEEENSEGGRLRRKIGTTECTTAASIPWIRFWNPGWWRLARSFNPIGEGGRSAIGRKERQRRLRQTDEKGNGRKPKDGGEKPPLLGCDKTLVERQLRRAFFFFFF